jgi:hypothetical protein
VKESSFQLTRFKRKQINRGSGNRQEKGLCHEISSSVFSHPTTFSGPSAIGYRLFEYTVDSNSPMYSLTLPAISQRCIIDTTQHWLPVNKFFFKLHDWAIGQDIRNNRTVSGHWHRSLLVRGVTIQKGFHPWIRGQDGVVWWKKPEFENLVTE